MAPPTQPESPAPDLRTRKSRLVGELATARSNLARDWQDVTRAANLPARLKAGLSGHSGAIATTAATAVGLFAARAFRASRSRRNRLPRLHPLLHFALLEGVNLIAKKEWQRVAARRVLDFFR